MQLIQLTESTAVDVKKTMSTLGETFETSQMKGTIPDIENDCPSNKIPLNINDIVSKSVEDVTLSSSREQAKEKIKDLNGIAKSNGDAQNEDKTLERDYEICNDNVENGSTANGQSNDSLVLTKSCKSPACTPADTLSPENINETCGNKNTNFEENVVNGSNKDIDFKEETNISSDLKMAHISLNDKDVTDDVSIENSSADGDMHADTDKKVTEANKLKDIEVSVEHEDTTSVSAFSPNSDANERDINISAQLQQLEDDASMEDDVSPPTFDKISANENHTFEKENEVTELENDKPDSPIEKQEKEIQATTMEQNNSVVDNIEEQAMTTKQKDNKYVHIIKEQDRKDVVDSHKQNLVTKITEGSVISTDKELIEENRIARNVVPAKDLEIAPIDKKLDKSPNASLDHFTEEVVENKIAIDTVDQQLVDNVTDMNASEVAIGKQLLDKNQKVNSNDIIMEVDDIKPVSTEEKLDSSNIADTDVDKIPIDQKNTKAKDFIEMVAENSQAFDVSEDKQPTEGDKTQQNEVMDVDDTDVLSLATPDNTIHSYNASDKLSLIQKETEVENHVEMADSEKSDDSSVENKNKSTEISKENEMTTIKQKYSNDVVMEIDEVQKVPIVKQIVSDVAVNIVQNTTEVNDCEETVKQDAIIKITDKKDGHMNNSIPVVREVKNDEASELSEVISIDDSVKDAVLEDSTKSLIDVQMNNSIPVIREVKNDEASELSEVISIYDSVKDAVAEEEAKSLTEVEIMDEDDIKAVEEKYTQKKKKQQEKIREKNIEKTLPVVCKLSNTMNILSDDEDDPPVSKPSEDMNILTDEAKKVEENKCITLDDDDDIMFIEDTNSQGPKDEEKKCKQTSDKVESEPIDTPEIKTNPDTGEKEISSTKIEEVTPKIFQKDDSTIGISSQPKVEESKPVEPSEIKETKTPLITKTFLKSVTKNLADMTRNELEDFCILKLVESVVDMSNLNEIKGKMKTMAQTVEDLRKKTLALTKQNRDLQVVVKTVQEDQKKRNTNPMMPMKITRSVGMQVVLSSAEKSILKKKLSMPSQPPPMTPVRPVRNVQSPKTQKSTGNNIPVPRLVPASSPTVKSPATTINNGAKPTVSAVRNTTPQRPEKRPHSKLSSASAVTVDLTDDEPPAKVTTKNPTPPVRLVPSQNLMPAKTRPQFGPAGNSPRKVYIPISSNNQNMRPGAAVIRNFVAPTPRPRQPSVVRMQTVRLNQIPSTNRHPAPLPDAMKQYQPPTWKALPPAPDLKLSKVDNGIVISWKFEGYQPDTYEEVASFQLYAYQETSTPPSTALWKKIGDIKALPLPMACTLTQFMSGFKYYFAVRAIDVRSRIGPFSLPGSIMLISKS